jgi:hypothetical protein
VTVFISRVMVLPNACFFSAPHFSYAYTVFTNNGAYYLLSSTLHVCDARRL